MRWPAAPVPLHDAQGLQPVWQAAELSQLLREVLQRGESGFQLAAVVLSCAKQIPLDFNNEGVLRQWFGHRKALLAGGVWWWMRKYGRPGKGGAVLLPDSSWYRAWAGRMLPARGRHPFRPKWSETLMVSIFQI